MTDEELIRRMRYETGSKVNYHEQAADRIEELLAKLKVLEKVELRLKTTYPEKSGHYFICGESPIKDDNGLPEHLHVCPAYGADWMMTYQRTDKTQGQEW